MRTTLTLDDDLAFRLESECRRSGRPFEAVVNDALRRGLDAALPAPSGKRFEIRARALGIRPGIDYDKVGDLLEQLGRPESD